MPANLIAIDGPAASGKTTVGKMLAQRLGYLILDTGCMYRALTLAALKRGVDVHDETAVSQLARDINLEVVPVGEHQDGRAYTVLLDGEDVTWDIRAPEVDANVSQVSKYAAVRQEMVAQQRAIGQRGRVVMVGRDIGTVVLPDAPLKLYITATPEERARRRLRDRQAQGNGNSEYEAILADIKRRDRIDSNRTHSPLKPAVDAILIDSSDHTAVEILNQILALQESNA
ncbi:MAG: (d)CMP kinase [Anaerolineales bacterium]|nr:(d)CMP kinase [Anaerolineales bacterium]